MEARGIIGASKSTKVIFRRMGDGQRCRIDRKDDLRGIEGLPTIYGRCDLSNNIRIRGYWPYGLSVKRLQGAGHWDVLSNKQIHAWREGGSWVDYQSSKYTRTFLRVSDKMITVQRMGYKVTLSIYLSICSSITLLPLEVST